jgi:hypothetical protein
MKPLALAAGLTCLSTSLCAALTIFAASQAFAQTEASRIDKSKVAATGAKASDFVPAGWKIESEAKGDVNGDARADDVLTVQEEKAAEGKQRGRALIVLMAQADGRWKSAAVADRLLQCADCGGGMAELEVKVEKGVIHVFQAQGNNGSNMSNETYLFRFEPATSRFQLIGADYVGSGGPDNIVKESTNYLTGERKTTRSKGKRDVTTPSKVDKAKIYLEDVDNEKMGQEAFARIGV